MTAVICLAAVLAAVPTGPAAGAEPNLLALLPTQVNGWTATGEDEVYTGRGIFQYMDGAGEIYLAYRFRKLAVREYARSSRPPIVAELYDMSDSEDAYGVFTYDTDGTPVSIGQGGLYSAGLLRFWKGRYFARLLVQRETPESKAALLELGKAVANAIRETGKPPDLLRCVPRQGLMWSEVRYLRSNTVLSSLYFISDSNILGLGQDTEAVLCRWQTPSGKVRGLICRYPSSQQAQKAFDAFTRTYLRLPTTGDRAFAVVERGAVAGAQRMGNLLIMAFEAGTRQQCQNIIDAVAKQAKEAFHAQARERATSNHQKGPS
ncbi:MAG: DUF6599 family protein [Armatimonadota bacterium]